MIPTRSRSKLNPPILEAVLTYPSGRCAKFRWHQAPCPGNEQVSIFYYNADGDYDQSFYIHRESARAIWLDLISDGWVVTQEPKIV
jgi:hypothetical protein